MDNRAMPEYKVSPTWKMTSDVKDTPAPQSVAVRRANLDDLDAIVSMARAAANAAHWSSEQYRKRLAAGHILAAESAGKTSAWLCGFVCVHPVADEWEIENIVAATDSLRRGVASQLLGALIQWGRGAGASALLLEVRESNLAGRGLYDKFGFREVGRRRLYYQYPAEDALLYSLQLVS